MQVDTLVEKTKQEKKEAEVEAQEMGGLCSARVYRSELEQRVIEMLKNKKRETEGIRYVSIDSNDVGWAGSTVQSADTQITPFFPFQAYVGSHRAEVSSNSHTISTIGIDFENVRQGTKSFVGILSLA